MIRLTRFHCVLLALLLLSGGCEDTGPPPEKLREVTKNGITMIALPAGQFTMGDDNGEDNETPAHKVTLVAFTIDKYEVTQKAYWNLMGTVPPTKTPGDDRPVQQVTWRQAAEYCNARSRVERLQQCYDTSTWECNFDANGYRLPTEAEWEYACRAGTTGEYSFEDGSRALEACAWFKDNARKIPHPVGRKRPNPWGLHDMQGNVSEWCNDYYDKGYYRKGPSANPQGPASGKYRVIRGGNWNSGADSCRSSARYFEAPMFADVCFQREVIGFRCVRRETGLSLPKTSSVFRGDDLAGFAE